jgi:proline iminopeptidase
MDLRPGLSQVQCPVLLLAGEQDPVTPIEDAEEIAAALPADLLRFVRFPGVGHGPWRDDPETTARVLREFIADA